MSGKRIKTRGGILQAMTEAEPYYGPPLSDVFESIAFNTSFRTIGPRWMIMVLCGETVLIRFEEGKRTRCNGRWMSRAQKQEFDRFIGNLKNSEPRG